MDFEGNDISSNDNYEISVDRQINASKINCFEKIILISLHSAKDKCQCRKILQQSEEK